jgi:kumamolisin
MLTDLPAPVTLAFGIRRARMATSKTHVSLSGSERATRPGSQVLGSVEPSERLGVTVYVRRRPDAPELPSVEELGALPPAERELLSDDDLAATLGASQQDIDRVKSFAQEHGLTVDGEDAVQRSVHLSGTASDMSKAFQVELERYHYAGQEYRGRTGPVMIPKDLDGIVEAVFGLDDRPTGRPRLRRSPQGRVALDTIARRGVRPRGYLPTELESIYNFPPGFMGEGQTIAILAFNEPDSHGGYKPDALRIYFEQVLQRQMPDITDVVVHGQGNDPGDDSGTDPRDTTGEVMLDLCVAGAMAPSAHLSVYFTRFTERGWVDVVTAVATATDPRPSVMSISYGNPEDDPRSAWTTAAIRKVDEAFAVAGLRGITVVAASGDDGSRDQGGGDRAHADFPASSPHVLGCGGTRLIQHNGAVVGEVVWGTGPNDATGGGVSRLFPLPDWQQHVGVPPAANPDHRIGRGVPDVAGVADPQSGVIIVTVDAMHLAIVGGTSATAPLWAALIARINQALGAPLGYFNPLLYTQLSTGVLRDILYGTNGAYWAGPGWDACTGLGSPDGVLLLSALQQIGSSGNGHTLRRVEDARMALGDDLARVATAAGQHEAWDTATGAFAAYLESLRRAGEEVDLSAVDPRGLMAIAQSMATAAWSAGVAQWYVGGAPAQNE